jgi:hypothetical protein
LDAASLATEAEDMDDHGQEEESAPVVTAPQPPVKQAAQAPQVAPTKQVTPPAPPAPPARPTRRPVPTTR